MPRVDLHALPGFVVLCQSTDFERKGGGFSGLISFPSYSWNRILRPPGVGLQCVGWYRANYFRNKVPLGVPLGFN